MERQIDMNEVSDGRRYTANDLVRADCGGCQGCSACCHKMGSSITLDPLDVFSLCSGLHQSCEQLLETHIELNIADRLILPNLKMEGKEEVCTFLDQKGRCQIYAFRPGMCRLFPLGRYYEEDSFWYFLQVHECPKENKAKIKVKKWLGISELKTYERFVKDWHDYLKGLRETVTKEPEKIKTLSMEVLHKYYLAPYQEEKDFYQQFYQRFSENNTTGLPHR